VSVQAQVSGYQDGRVSENSGNKLSEVAATFWGDKRSEEELDS